MEQNNSFTDVETDESLGGNRTKTNPNPNTTKTKCVVGNLCDFPSTVCLLPLSLQLFTVCDGC